MKDIEKYINHEKISTASFVIESFIQEVSSNSMKSLTQRRKTLILISDIIAVIVIKTLRIELRLKIIYQYTQEGKILNVKSAAKHFVKKLVFILIKDITVRIP